MNASPIRYTCGMCLGPASPLMSSARSLTMHGEVYKHQQVLMGWAFQHFSAWGTHWLMCRKLNPWAYPPISQRLHEPIIEISWKIVNFIFYSCDPNRSQFLYMSQQLWCRGMRKIVTWFGHNFSCKNNIYFLEDLVYELTSCLWNKPQGSQ